MARKTVHTITVYRQIHSGAGWLLRNIGTIRRTITARSIYSTIPPTTRLRGTTVITCKVNHDHHRINTSNPVTRGRQLNVVLGATDGTPSDLIPPKEK